MECLIPECPERVVPTKGRGRAPKYCPTHQTNRNGARTVTRATGGTRFIGVDGEGWTDGLGEHRYAQLSVGSRTLFGAEHLDCLAIFAFLWEGFEEDPRASYVGFYLGYDFAQWFRTLPEHIAQSLLGSDGIAKRRRKMSGGNTVPYPVRYRGWEFDILGNKRFKLRKIGCESWMYICDTGPFFQTAFMAVLDPKKWPHGSPVSEEEYRVISEGKQKRADYNTREQWLAAEEELTRYNVYENRALSKVMGEYEKGLTAVGVHLERDQWYGPGQAAQAWMDNIALTKREVLEETISDEVFEFARRAYYGGRFEVFAHGHIPGPAYEYDINSAYPAAMAVMPSWEECEFEWRTASPVGTERSGHTNEKAIWMIGAGLALLDCTTEGADAVATGLPHREKSGRILFPRRTRGVRWSFELEAAIAAGLVSDFTVHRALLVEVGGGSVLNAEIPLIYQQRLDVGKESSAGKAMKLIYNSAYGKQAQSVGSPKYSNPLSASFITAHCRASILMAIAMHPNGSSDLLMIATDGVYFRSPHPTLELSETELGKWSASTKQNMTIVMPGVYYDDAGRAALSAGSVKVKSRGIPAAAFAASIGRLDVAFSTLANDPTVSESWPVLDVPIKFKVKTPKAALNEGKWGRAGTVERDVDRKLSTDPSLKRQGPASSQLLLFGDTSGLPYLDRGIVRTVPYDEGAVLESTPYSKDFGIMMDGEGWGIGPDQDIQGNLMDLLKGDG